MFEFLENLFGETPVRRLEKARQDPSLYPEIARDLFQRPQVFVKSITKHAPQLLAAAPLETKRNRWANYVGTQVANPFQISQPASLDELKALLREGKDKGYPVRAVGSGHAWSDVALTDGILIDTHALNRQLPLDAGTLRNPADADMLFHVEAGITIRDLNTTLDQQGKALLNMGGYDGQTLAGVISTSTHGSGLTLPSFPGLVEAFVVVTADGDVLQIERPNGISDPAAFARQYAGQRKLLQDDRLFQAFAVSVGSLGIIYAVILRITKKYWLSEVRVIKPWSEVREILKQPTILDQYRHVEVLLNPHKVNGENSCLLTTRKQLDGPPPVTPSEEEQRLRRVFEQFIISLDSHGAVLAWLFNEYPEISPYLLEEALKALQSPNDSTPYADISYRIFNVGGVNGYSVICAEYGLDIEIHVDATDAIIGEAEAGQRAGVYHSSPVALRWVAGSPGYLSMQPRPTCMIEMPLFRDVFGGNEMLWRYENLLTRQFSARPHWGQLNFLTQDMIRSLYPQLDGWMSVFKEFNKDGRFYSKFTDRVGFSSHAPAAAAEAGAGR
jgi:hypothetical protein